MNWSAQQLAIFEFFSTGTGNAVVQARAGTGKTTTIKEAFAHAPEARMLYAVFNKKNQVEASRKISDHRVDVATLHSVGYRFIKKVWSNARPDKGVELDRASSALVSHPHLRTPEFMAIAVKLVGYLKNCYVAPTEAEAFDTAQAFLLLSGSAEMDVMLVKTALRALELSKTRDAQGRISFDDMVWLPVALNIVKPTYDMVVIDEAQDMNVPQLKMARGASRGRVVVVGDDRQAIYGFRGAAQDGMEMMKVTLRAKTFPLTVTYRCPKSVVALAKTIVPDYQAADSAPEGVVKVVPDATAAVGDAILSRLNAPLMPLALSLLRKGIPARVEGRDIGKQLVTMVNTLKAKSVPDFLGKIQAWLDKQKERLAKSKNAEKKIEQAEDIAATLSALAQDAKNVREIVEKLDNLFGGLYLKEADAAKADEKPVVLLSTVHKAKGLEWKRVFVISSTFRLAKGGEEANIYYVAVTRAMSELYLVGGTLPEGQPVNAPAATVEAPAPVPAPAPDVPAAPAPRAKRELAVPASVTAPARSSAGRTREIVFQHDEIAEWETPLSGMAYLEPGTVFQHCGTQYVSVRLGQCNAACVPMSGGTTDIITYRGKGLEIMSKEIKRRPRTEKLSRQIDKSLIVRVMSADELNNFLADSGSGEGSTNNAGTGTKRMKKETSVPIKDFALKLAKAGKSEKEITAAAKAEDYKISPSSLYIIGREWRRVNGGKKSAPKKAAKSAAVPPPRPSKKSAPAPAAPAPRSKKSAPAPAKAAKAPAKKAVKAAAPVAPVPPPRPTPAAPAAPAPDEGGEPADPSAV